MRELEIMLKPASSLCNLRCSYCFYEAVAGERAVPSQGVMSPETAGAVLEHIFGDLEPGDRVGFAFQGGEPTLAGPGFFRDFIRRAEELNRGCEVSYRLQTNGVLLDEEWCALLKERDFLVGLSLDCLRPVHNACRRDGAGEGTFAQVMAAKERLDAWGIDYNVLATLTRELAARAEAVWAFLRAEGIGFVQFTPCFGETPQALTPADFARFYGELIPLWHRAWEEGTYISVKLIDDLVTLLAEGRVTACGLTGRCHPQIVVESNGDVYPCDFYATDAWRIGNLCREGLKALYEAPGQARFRRRARQRPLCGDCRYQAICGGGCPRMQRHVCYGEGDSGCGMQALLDRQLGTLLSVARQLGT